MNNTAASGQQSEVHLHPCHQAVEDMDSGAFYVGKSHPRVHGPYMIALFVRFFVQTTIFV